MAPPSFRLPQLGAALASTGLASLRSELWDYYLIDGAVMAFFSVQIGTISTADEDVGGARRRGRLQSLLAPALIAIIAVFQVSATGPLKRLVDHRAGACSALEKAMRAGWMKPTELSDSPFGFTAWHLFPYYIAHEGRNSPGLDGFGVYVGNNSVNVRIEGVGRREAKAAESGNRGLGSRPSILGNSSAGLVRLCPLFPRAPEWGQGADSAAYLGRIPLSIFSAK